MPAVTALLRSGQEPPLEAQARGKLLLLGTRTASSGAPMALLRLAAGMAETGWDCRAAFLYDYKPLDGADYSSVVLLDRQPAALREHVRIARRLIALLRRERPDAIIMFLPYASVLGAVLARLCGITTRITSHRVPRSTYGAAMRLADLAAAWTGCYTDVIAVSRGVAAECNAYPAWLRARVTVVYNGLRDWSRSPLSRSEARSALGLPISPLLVAAVGRLQEQKNYALLIDAVAAVPNAHLAIAGDGPLRSSLEAQARHHGITDRISFLGAIPRSDVRHLLAAADLFAQPSLFEGQSNALLEALASGLPALVSDRPEQIETITEAEDQVAGAALPLGRPELWADAISVFENEPNNMQKARTVAARRSNAFSFDLMIKGFTDVLVTRHRRRGGHGN